MIKPAGPVTYTEEKGANVLSPKPNIARWIWLIVVLGGITAIIGYYALFIYLAVKTYGHS